MFLSVQPCFPNEVQVLKPWALTLWHAHLGTILILKQWFESVSEVRTTSTFTQPSFTNSRATIYLALFWGGSWCWLNCKRESYNFCHSITSLSSAILQSDNFYETFSTTLQFGNFSDSLHQPSPDAQIVPKTSQLPSWLQDTLKLPASTLSTTQALLGNKAEKPY